jgi:hypothetical protein
MDAMLQTALALHAEDPPPLLSIDLPMSPLMDSVRCQELTKLLAEVADAWETKWAMPNLWQQLPKSPGLYMFVWAPELDFAMAKHNVPSTRFRWALYVGKAGDVHGQGTLQARYHADYAKHTQRDPEALWTNSEPANRTERLQHYLRLRPLEYWWAVVEDRKRIQTLERQLIRMLNPPVNRQGARGRTLRSVGKGQPAWT